MYIIYSLQRSVREYKYCTVYIHWIQPTVYVCMTVRTVCVLVHLVVVLNWEK